MNEFRNYSASELAELLKSETPTAVNLILDETAVDFLLGLANVDQPIHDANVEALAKNIEDVVLQTIGTMAATESEGLVDGLHRLAAIKELGYPESLVATVVFGNTSPQS